MIVKIENSYNILIYKELQKNQIKLNNMQIFPGFIIICAGAVIIIHLPPPFCFSENTLVKVLENGIEVEKQIKDIKKDDMVLVHYGKEKTYNKVLDNKLTEGDIEFYVIKVKSLEDPSKIKEIAITPEHLMITMDKKNEIKLVAAKELKGDEIMDTEDGLFQVYEIGKKTMKNKYTLSVKGGCILANGIFTSSICSGDEAKLLKPTLEEFNKFHTESISIKNLKL